MVSVLQEFCALRCPPQELGEKRPGKIKPWCTKSEIDVSCSERNDFMCGLCPPQLAPFSVLVIQTHIILRQDPEVCPDSQ